MAKTLDDGINWDIFRTSSPTDVSEIYAYPNPFSPTHHNILHSDGHVRVQYHLDSLSTSATVRLEIYDFAMDQVYKGEAHYVSALGDHSEVWNGRNNEGKLVANGTYFCKITKKINQKEKSYWTKLILIK